jgi:putative component of toxin-antitoxin plasmid stabilization module
MSNEQSSQYSYFLFSEEDELFITDLARYVKGEITLDTLEKYKIQHIDDLKLLRLPETRILKVDYNLSYIRFEFRFNNLLNYRLYITKDSATIFNYCCFVINLIDRLYPILPDVITADTLRSRNEPELSSYHLQGNIYITYYELDKSDLFKSIHSQIKESTGRSIIVLRIGRHTITLKTDTELYYIRPIIRECIAVKIPSNIVITCEHPEHGKLVKCVKIISSNNDNKQEYYALISFNTRHDMHYNDIMNSQTIDSFLRVVTSGTVMTDTITLHNTTEDDTTEDDIDSRFDKLVKRLAQLLVTSAIIEAALSNNNVRQEANQQTENNNQ